MRYATRCFVLAFVMLCQARTNGESIPRIAIKSHVDRQDIADPLTYQPGRIVVTIDNTYPETLTIESLRFEIANVVYDDVPRLTFDLMPLFDLLVIHTANVGGGVFSGGRLDIFPNNARSALGGYKLQDLLDLKETSITLPSFEVDDVQVLRLGPKADFMFSSGASVDKAALGPPPPHADMELAIPRGIVRIITEDKHLNRGKGFQARTTFDGVLHVGDSQKQIRYLARQLGNPYSSSQHSRMIRVFPQAPTDEPDLLTQWVFSFGDLTIIQHTVREVVERRESRIDLPVDVTPGKVCDCSERLDFLIKPNKGVTFQVNFYPQKSCTFDVHVNCQYRFNTPSVITVPVEHSPFPARAYVPQASALQITPDASHRLLGRVLDRDPEVANRTRIFLETARFDSPFKIRDALRIASDVNNTEMRQVLSSTVLRAMAADAEPISDSIIAVASRVNPKETVEYVLRKQPEMISTCLSIDESRAYMKENSESILQLLTTNDHSVDVSILMWLGSADAKRAIIQSLDTDAVDVSEMPGIVWVLSQQADSDAIRALRACLQRTGERALTASADTADSETLVLKAISHLRMWEDYRYTDTVLSLLNGALGSEHNPELMREYLEYAGRKPQNARAVSVLLRARVYPYDSVVRKRARELLGEDNH